MTTNMSLMRSIVAGCNNCRLLSKTFCSLVWMLCTSTRGCALDRGANSRRPLDRLFVLCEPVTLAFDLLI